MSEVISTACKCCGEDKSDKRIKDLASDLAANGYRWSCAYRCMKHNREVGSEDTSQHPLGLAIDVQKPIHINHTIQLIELIFRHKPSIMIIEPWGFHVDFRRTV